MLPRELVGQRLGHVRTKLREAQGRHHERHQARRQALEAIKRIARGQALAAGLPEDRLPEVKVMEEATPALYNDPKLTDEPENRAREAN